MKLRAKIVVLVLITLSGGSLVSAEEHPAPVLAALSSTTVGGYVHTGEHWQPHVCRPVLPLGLRRVVLVSSDGTSRVIGHSVRCRHAVVFVPSNARVLPAPNRSSRFVSADVRRAPRPASQYHSGGLSGVVITFAQPQ